jgi:DNA-directed RNA polymerase specialized sigma24 family protein
VPGHDAEDVVSEVFLQVFKGIKTFTKDGNPAAFRRWLYVITRFKVLEYWAAIDRRRVPLNGDFPATDPPADDSGEIDGDTVDLGPLLEKIRPDWYAFWGCAVDERSAEDVAKELGISTRAVETAVLKVQRCLREEDEDGVPGRVLLLHGLLKLIRVDFEPKTFQAFLRVAVDGCPAEEVEKELGFKTVGAVHTAKARVLKRLRKEFKAQGFNHSDGDVVAADVAAVAMHEVTS